MEKVLVTGGSGLIGQAIVENLLNKGYSVRIFDKTLPNLKNVEFIEGDILDINVVEKAVEGCDYVIHLAAVMGVMIAQNNPTRCLDVNIYGTRNILKAAAKHKIKKVLIASSSEVYGDPEVIPIKEDALRQPKSEYGFSKMIAEEYAKAFSKEFGLNYVIVRFFNVYGPWQRGEWVVPKWIYRVLENKSLEIFGEGNQIRAFCYVEDAAEGAVQALLSEKNNEVFNIGNSSEPISMKELAETILKVTGSTAGMTFLPFKKTGHEVGLFKKSEVIDRTDAREIYRRAPNTSKAKELLGFEAKIKLEEGLKRVYEYKKSKAA